jgi:hypothetical protein
MELLFSQVVGFPEQLTPQISGLNSFIIEGGNQIAALNQQLTDEQRLRTTADGTRTTVAATLTRLQSAATGRYRLVFEPAFSDLPAVTVTPIRSSTDDFYLAVMSDLSTERVDVSIVLQSGKDTSARFAFIAAGLHERG